MLRSFCRLLFVFVCLGICCLVRPSGHSLRFSLAAGIIAGSVGVALDMLIQWSHSAARVSVVIGGAAGVLVGSVIGLALRTVPGLQGMGADLPLLAICFFAYLGIQAGAAFTLPRRAAAEPDERPVRDPEPMTGSAKILDTSTIIDGRIADIAEAGFLEGPVVIAEFVLRELQAVADSNDPSKRQRGRRGLDILERMRLCARIRVQVVKDDFQHIREVDLKLIELTNKYRGRLVTNDFNLNKVAHLHDVPVMNVNDLANHLRAVVLPGERLSIAILKEGKEPNQGVGYLNDGTMVVVDHARRWIGHTVEIQVTSVLQTPSGKMIFGRSEEPKASDTLAAV